MRLKLSDRRITIENNEVPEALAHTSISYKYELGTNHLVPKLYINNVLKLEKDKGFIDLTPYDELNLKVKLCDSNNQELHTYTGVFSLYKLGTVGPEAHIDIYKKAEELEQQVKDLLEKGDII